MRVSFFHKGVGLSLNLKTIIKVLAPLAVVGWAVYFWVYPTHAYSLFDDDFEGEFVGDWADWNTPDCSRGVALSTDFAAQGFWSLSADRSAAGAAGCTDQIRSVTGHHEYEIVRIRFDILATETNILNAGLTFYEDEASGAGIGGVKIQAEDIELSGGTTVLAGITDGTWYAVEYYVNFVTGCQSARVNEGAWATEECGITETYVSRVRFKAGGSVNTIAYVDDLRLTFGKVGIGDGGVGDALPPEFDIWTDNPLSIGDVIADYPSHDDIYGSCDFWIDGLTCVWTWISYAIVPVENELAGLLGVPITTLVTRWPWSYISVPYARMQDGLITGACPFGESLLGGTLLGSSLPEIDMCEWFDEANFDDLMADHPWVEGVFISGIYLALGLMLWQRARGFLTQE